MVSEMSVQPGRCKPKRLTPHVLLAAAALVLLSVATARADIRTETAELIPLDGAPADGFGQAVAMDGDTVVVGARGAAYVFVRSGDLWEQQAKLVPNDGILGFGLVVAIDGNRAVIGSVNDGAYVFERSEGSWSEIAKLTTQEPHAIFLFGSAVAISGITALVGAWADMPGSELGSAYVFAGTSAWSQQAKLTAFDAERTHNFGRSVALSGNTAIIGANGEDRHRPNAGSAYVFVRSGTWTFQRKLIASDFPAQANLGWSVDIDGDTALTGTRFGEAFYVWTRIGNIWSERTKVLASDGVSGARFGSAVSIEGGTIVSGAPLARAAYVFTGSGADWPEQSKLVPSDPNAPGEFGFSVSTSAGTAVVGSPSCTDSADPACIAGRAYVYDLGPRAPTVLTFEEFLADEEISDQYAALGVSLSLTNGALPRIAAEARGATYFTGPEGSNTDDAPGSDAGANTLSVVAPFAPNATTLVIRFDELVEDVSLELVDVDSLGEAEAVEVRALLGGTLIDAVTVPSGANGSRQQVTLTGVLNEVHVDLFRSGAAVDNVTFLSLGLPPEPTEIGISVIGSSAGPYVVPTTAVLHLPIRVTGDGLPLAGREVAVEIGSSLYFQLTDEDGIAEFQIKGDLIGAPGSEVGGTVVSVEGLDDPLGIPFTIRVEPFRYDHIYEYGGVLRFHGAIYGVELSGARSPGQRIKIEEEDPARQDDDRVVLTRIRAVEGGVAFRPSIGGSEGFLGVKRRIGGKVGVGVFIEVTAEQETRFESPYQIEAQIALAGVLLEDAALLLLAGPPGLDFLFLWIDRNIPFVTNHLSRQAGRLGIEVRGGAEGGLSFLRGTVPGLGTVALGLDGSLGGAWGGSMALEEFLNAGTPVQRSAVFEIHRELDLSLVAGLGAGDKAIAEIEGPKSLKDLLGIEFSGGVGGGFEVALFVDAMTGVLDRLEISIKGELAYGTGIAGKINSWGGSLDTGANGIERVIKVTVPDYQIALIASAVLDSLQAGLVGAAAAPPLLMGPTAAAFQITVLVHALLPIEFAWELEKASGKAASLDIASAERSVGILALGGELKVNRDESMRFTAQRGVTVGGRLYRTMVDDGDSLPPLGSGTTDLDILVNGLEGVATLAGDLFAEVKQLIIRETEQVIITAAVGTAILVVKARNEASDFLLELRSWFADQLPPLLLARAAASQTMEGGYGIGGFHRFTPEGRILASPASLSIGYEDPEVAAIDETALRLFRWDVDLDRWVAIDLTPGDPGLDTSANLYTASITVLGTYTLAPDFPDGDIPLTGVSGPQVLGLGPIVLTAGPVRTNAGATVPDGTLLTVEVARGDDPDLLPPAVLDADEDPTTGGTQVATISGLATVTLADPSDPGQVTVKVTSVHGAAEGTLELAYLSTLDADADGHDDPDDNCLVEPNPDQEDADGDGVGDLCDFWPFDADNDGVPVGIDNCPAVTNAGQIDGDSDFVGSACDNCPNISNPDQADADMNGIGDVCQCGDVDGNGFKNVPDALKIARGELPLADPDFGRCDVNGDGLCDLSDALEIAGGRVSSVSGGQLCPAYLEPPPEPPAP